MSQPVREYCDSQNGYMVFRCCRSNDNLTFIALNLMDSNLTIVPDFTEHENFNLSVIDLRLNPELQPSPANDFIELTYLDLLLLPEQYTCPGGYDTWEEIVNATDPAGHNCSHQRSSCSNSTNLCDENASYCSTNGPNHYLCLCKSNYHGYKCLRKGTFPAGLFFGLTVSVTFFLTGVLYWTQRRHVKKTN